MLFALVPFGPFLPGAHTTSRSSFRCRAAAARFKKYSNDSISPKINKPSSRVSTNWLLQIPYSTPATITKGRIAVNGPNPNTLVALRRSVDGIILNARLATTATAYGRKTHSILAHGNQATPSSRSAAACDPKNAPPSLSAPPPIPARRQNQPRSDSRRRLAPTAIHPR